MKVRRAPIVDEVTRTGETVVMIEDQVALLSVVASAVWRAIPESGAADVAQVAESLVAEFGSPAGADAEAATLTIVAELVGMGLLMHEG